MKTEEQPTVLLVEDHLVTATVYKKVLSHEPILLTHLKTGNATLAHFSKNVPDIMLLDLGLPDISGMDVLKYVYEQQLKCIVIVVTARNTVEIAVEAMRYGALDFLKKPCKNTQLVVTLREALKKYHLSQPEFYEETRPQYHNFIGASQPMQMVYQMIDNVMTSNATVLITGETGTGKELCTQAICQENKRANNPFMVCNCAAIPEKLMESHLFGHVRGAFTGAISEQKGLISQANGGVLFLDEIGELPLSMQSTLLRFVQNKTFSKVGSHKLEKVAVRLICATNRELLAEIKAGRFREDLYYRLNSVEIKLPALRERGEDVLQLAKFFLHQFVKEEQKKFQGFSAEAEKKLLSCDWPGNVRQLQNTIHHVVVLNKGKIITVDMLAAKIAKNISDKNTPLPTESTQQIESVENHLASVAITSGDTLRFYKDIEKEVILTALEFCGGNVEKTAKMLKVGPATIHRKKRQWKGD